MKKPSAVKKNIGRFTTSLSNSTRSLRVGLGNTWRKFRRRKTNLDYVLISLEGNLPERNPEQPKFIQRQIRGALGNNSEDLSLETLNAIFERIGESGLVKGVVLKLDGLDARFATLQNLRRAMQRLQNKGIEVIVYTPYLDSAHYFVAAAADKIIAPPPVEFSVMGVYSETQFFKNALEKIGVQLDIIQISPYKSAMDPFGKEAMTPELREQITRLLDDAYSRITSAIVAGRRLSENDVVHFIDNAPFPVQDALSKGLVDHVAYEDEILAILGIEKEGKPDKINQIEDVLNLLPKQAKRKSKKQVGVISVMGSINMGDSRSSPVPLPVFGGQSAGSDTVVQMIRQAEQDERLGALVLHVDSPGGSAVASDLMAREIGRLRKKMPVLVYMGNVAASGGYYIAANSDHIMCQPATITGSIGVISARPSTSDLFNKLDIKRVIIEKGENAGLYRNASPMTDRERATFMRSIESTYDQFKHIVADGRKLPFETLDDICLGKVWTGNQALDHKLIDSFGDFQDAIQKAAELADIKVDKNTAIQTQNIYANADGTLLPEPFGLAEDVVAWLNGDFQSLLNGRPLLMPSMMVEIK